LPSLCYPFSKEWIPAENNIYRTRRSLKRVYQKILELCEPIMNLELLTAFCALRITQSIQIVKNYIAFYRTGDRFIFSLDILTTVIMVITTARIREYLMSYRRPGFLAFV
jgi:hypothetical protein